MSGLVADSRTLVDHARVECASHWFVYNADMKVESVAQAVSNLAIRFGDADDDGPAMVRETGRVKWGANRENDRDVIL